MSEEIIDNSLLDRLDNLYLTIDTLNNEELDKIILYAQDQKTIVKLSDKRKKDLSNQLRIERIKMKKELNNIKKVIIEEDEDSESENKKVIKKPIIRNQSKKNV